MRQVCRPPPLRPRMTPALLRLKPFRKIVSIGSCMRVRRRLRVAVLYLLLLAYLDWSLHLANSPGRRVTLAQDAAQSGCSFLRHRNGGPFGRRSPLQQYGWNQLPFNVIAQAAVLAEEWWREATLGPPGVAKRHSDMVAFGARQVLDVFRRRTSRRSIPRSRRRPQRKAAGISPRGSETISTI